MWKGKLRQPCDMKAYHVFLKQASEVALHFEGATNKEILQCPCLTEQQH